MVKLSPAAFDDACAELNADLVSYLPTEIGHSIGAGLEAGKLDSLLIASDVYLAARLRKLEDIVQAITNLTRDQAETISDLTAANISLRERMADLQQRTIYDERT